MNNEINYVSPFKRFCITVGNLPTAYLESMSYYESLTYLVNYLSNNVIPALNNNGEVVEELQEQFTILKNYVDNYFDNLDVQQEINNKLDEMVEDGTLYNLIGEYITNIPTSIIFNNLSEMISSTSLNDGNYTQTLGYYNLNDGGGGQYYITNNPSIIANGKNIIELNNDLKAVLIEDNDIKAAQYGVIPDTEELWVDDHWEFNLGTDYSDLLNELLQLRKPIILQNGCYYITKPLKLYSHSIIKGLDDMYSARLVYNGNDNTNAIETYDGTQEVSFLEISNMRITDIRESATTGYGIYINFATNHVLIHHIFMDHFASGGIYVGYNATNKAGDNIIIDDIWGVINNNTNSLITIGNFNNVCTISNIYCDGGKVLSRTAHGYNIGMINISNVKHEVHNDQTGSASINIDTTDYIILNSIIRRNTPATSIAEAGSITNVISVRGIYLNCHVAYGAAPLNGEPFPNLPYNNSEGLYFQEVTPVTNITKYVNCNGSYIYGKTSTLPVGRIGDIVFSGEKLLQKATTAGTNTGWLPFGVVRVYNSISDVPKWHIEVGECIYLLDDHKPYWLNDITSTVLHWYDASGTLVYSINQ